MSVLLLGVLLTLCSPLVAAQQPILIEKSRSPDGRKEIIIVPSDEDMGGASGTAKIRDVKSHQILGRFEWSGFGVRANSEAFNVLWSPDSKCFAINWELTRGFVTCAVYAYAQNGWHQVKLPDLSELSLRKAKAAGEAHVYVDENHGGKGHETALVWLPSHRLRIETGYRGIMNQDKNGEWEQLYWFTIQLVEGQHKTKPRAVVKTVASALDTAYRND